MAPEDPSKRGGKCSLRTYEIIYLLEIFFVICTISAQECFDDGNEFCIDQNDILSADLLPGSFLFGEQYKTSAPKAVVSGTVDGSFDSALYKMEYHRKRMNEYLCHGYMAEEIFKEVSTPRVKRHPESPSANNVHNFLGDDNVTIHDKLLADEGSSRYKNWLQRTTTLNDVYRHYTPRKKMKRKQDVQHDDIEEFDGEVTGYAMQAPLPSNGKAGVYEPSQEDDMLSSSTGHFSLHYGPSSSYGHHHGDHLGHHGDFFPSFHEEYYYGPHQQDHQQDHHHEEYAKPSYSKGKGHDLSIKDFFEIALTALAFLAFGLFVIQLLMNCTDYSGSRRIRRHVISLSSSVISKEDLNELSYRVLRSVEAAMVAEADSGNCLRRILCEDNQYSKGTKDDRRIWIPVWSLGMSWLSGRMLHKTPWSAMLDSVKASILGLGGVNCASFYPDCDLEGERTKRRRRRRK
ncbi:PREDICTED: uncharacterized protein LOC105565271 [Vollenhovia emeryi]|uniref:uncharacterized protein LOC105565271 n=1 Tax=Vollenhovia emeryi TaxID=411798 RepID=UPI0005F3D256|nr:PREDICTED: uncharacterized protein LOC105565271 [Vollenhovia emeryi]